MTQVRDQGHANVSFSSLFYFSSFTTLGYEAAARIETALGIPVLRHRTKKPGAIPEVLEYFQRVAGPETTYKDICIIGDRLLTDVMWGNLAGMYTIHTQILTEVGDNKVAAVVRRLENRFARLLMGRQWSAPPHPFQQHFRHGRGSDVNGRTEGNHIDGKKED